MKHTNRLAALAGLLLAVLLVGACAEPDRDDSGPAAGGPTTSPGELTVTGTVTKGVEPTCLLLDADEGGRYLLVGGERGTLRPGARVQVTGRVDRSLLGTCQQGEPLVVASVEAAP
jgi:Protein of unknown function (DUF5818)